ncbi:hypothetical protein C8Q79DRAFT_929631 [Trametes meyenii]|nr:hypothetical protein C8Q79DRAFT_929631 [Trametes meyenii]
MPAGSFSPLRDRATSEYGLSKIQNHHTAIAHILFIDSEDSVLVFYRGQGKFVQFDIARQKVVFEDNLPRKTHIQVYRISDVRRTNSNPRYVLQLLHEFSLHDSEGSSPILCLSQDSLVSSTMSGEIRVWDLHRGTLRGAFRARGDSSQDYIQAISYFSFNESGTGRKLAIGSSVGLEVWDVHEPLTPSAGGQGLESFRRANSYRGNRGVHVMSHAQIPGVTVNVVAAIPTQIEAHDDCDYKVSEWLDSRRRFRSAAKAIVHYGSIWPKEMPPAVADSVHTEYQKHIDAAHAWLRSTLCLLEKADVDGEGGALPFDVEPTPETIAILSFALDKNEAYFALLEKAVRMMLDYMQHERKLLQEWSASQAEFAAPNFKFQVPITLAMINISAKATHNNSAHHRTGAQSDKLSLRITGLLHAQRGTSSASLAFQSLSYSSLELPPHPPTRDPSTFRKPETREDAHQTMTTSELHNVGNSSNMTKDASTEEFEPIPDFTNFAVAPHELLNYSFSSGGDGMDTTEWHGSVWTAMGTALSGM